MIYLPRPEHVKSRLTRSLIDVVNYSISVEVYPRDHNVPLEDKDGIKVISGSSKEAIDGGKDLRCRPLGGAPFPEKNTLERRGVLTTDERLGAINLRLVHQKSTPHRWKRASDVPVITTFDLSHQGIQFPSLAFIKVQDLSWGGAFKGIMNKNLCHIQFWTAGPNVHAEYHNHNDNAFKELHTCLTQGTPKNGDNNIGVMCASKPLTCDSIIPVESLSIDENSFPPPPKKVVHCGLNPLKEHGRIWHEDATGNAVSYPRHEWAAGDGGKSKYINV
ncbi:hypothetical protein BJY01DRAFT_236502 [Aspergillus pseudoustus]|uniref:Aldos-2-ulose dehydratase/isomerase (AUDH) Cupin domain-containing protein n=1 Tax=Aspergillus pseudoustus TaxID=1810923 RepID=A0ABR4JQB5_9EURO